MIRHAAFATAVLLISSISLAADSLAADSLDQATFDAGAAIFRDQCVECHGADGQGSQSAYDEPLLGEKKLPELALYIEQTMPEEDPSLCVGEQASQVAHYIYHEFYSLAARRRKGLAPQPRVELSRLTVGQHRNAIADLIGHFTPEPQYEAEPSDEYRRNKDRRDSPPSPMRDQEGLRGAYFQSRGMSKANDLMLERADRRIDFDFGAGSPLATISVDQFAIIWDGSVFVRDTGYHEFRIRTQNGARLYVNHDAVEIRRALRDDSSVAGSAALIDAWVSRGEMREESARVFLLGGRRYPLRLEFFKYQSDSASIRLEWKTPGGIWQVMDHNQLTTSPSKRIFVTDISFPADDRSVGYERGVAVSREWIAASGEMAVAAAREVVDRLPILAGIENDTPDRSEKIRKFAEDFARHAFRRPLTPAESERIESILRENQSNLDTGLLRAVLMVLKSPSFLYTNLPSEDSQRSSVVASTLALVMWDSIPDAELTRAAADGNLQTEDQIRDQAKRMLHDERTRAKLASFFHHWLEIEQRDPKKDRELFPEFDDAVIADLRSSLLQFVDHVVWNGRSDYRELLEADYLILNDRLRAVYDPSFVRSESSATAANEFRQFVFPDQHRAGVLTHPYLLSALAYHNNTSPIHRGVFLTRNIVGRALKPPPEAVAFRNEEFPADLTMREKITLLTRDSACMSCHSLINPLGFALENYDPVGRFRAAEGDKPVDTKAQYVTADGSKVEFENAVDIAKFAIESEDARRAFVTQVFHHLVKQDPAAYGDDTIDKLTSTFAEDRYNVQNLIFEIAVHVVQAARLQPTNDDHG